MTTTSVSSHSDRFRRRVITLAPLDAEQETALAKAWKAGDRRAGERLIEANLRLVLAIAREYRRWGIPLDDLIQQGSIGLLKAVDRFDPGRDSRLRSYAAYWIRAEIRDYVVRGYRIVRLGTTRTERRAMRAYRSKQVNTVEELVEQSGMPEARARKLWPILTRSDSSIDAPGGATTASVGSAAEDSPESQTMDNQERALRQTVVAGALSNLSDREQRIVRERLMSDSPPTLEALSKTMGVSRERVRQLEKRAKEKLEGVLAPLVA